MGGNNLGKGKPKAGFEKTYVSVEKSQNSRVFQWDTQIIKREERRLEIEKPG